MSPNPFTASAVVVFACALTLNGCYDQTPSPTQQRVAVASSSTEETPADGGSAGAPQPSADAGGQRSFAATCVACTSAPSSACASMSESCEGTPKCDVMFRCAVERGCGKPNTDKVTCLTPCGLEAGLTGMDDPAIGPFLRLLTCSAESCASDCNAQ